MSFLTRKPENTASSPASAPEKEVEKKENVHSDLSVSGPKETVSLAALYRVVADSQKQIAEYLLAREADRSASSALLPNSVSCVPSEGNVGDMRQLTQTLPVILDRLDMLGQFMDQQMIPGICQRFDQLEALLRQLPAGGIGLSAPQTSGSDGSVSGSAETMSTANDTPALNPELANGDVLPSGSVGGTADIQPQAPSLSVAASSVGGKSDMTQLDKAFFGEMALEPSIQSEREYILQGILAHDSICSYLGGVLMMFQSSPPDRMVLLLKDLGEALYRWVNSLPGNDLEQFQEVMVRWAQWLCESAGLQNRIELVRPGQRFDAARHNSTTRGVAITQVHGWVVLRGNGSVYSKALVDVQ